MFDLIVQDNLNTHRLANLYLVFPPEEARRLAERFELHFTPKHGSWLNMAETMTGYKDRTAYAIPLDRLVEIMERYSALRR
jgi:hypothetical protein